MVEKAIDEVLSSDKPELLDGTRKLLEQKLAKYCTRVSTTRTYQLTERNERKLVGSTAGYIYPPQHVDEGKASHIVISSGTDESLKIYADRQKYSKRGVKGYVQSNFGVVEDSFSNESAYLGVQTNPKKSDVPDSLREAIRKIFEITEEQKDE